MTAVNNVTNLIREIMVNVSFDGDISLEKMETRLASSDLISSEFVKTSINLESEESTSRTGRVGFVLQSKRDERKLLRLKTGMLSYHMLSHYVSSEEYAKTFKMYWNGIAQNEIIAPRELSIRYINFIPLEAGEELSDVINFKVAHPYGDVKNEFYHAQFYMNELPVNVVIAFEGGKEKRGVFIDHSIKKFFDDNDSQSTIDFEQIIKQLRPVKNEVFFKMLTDKTKNRYFNGES